MSETEKHDETEQGVYERPGNEQHDSAQPLDHRELDDAQSAGRKASEDLHEGEANDDPTGQPD